MSENDKADDDDDVDIGIGEMETGLASAAGHQLGTEN